MDDQARLSEMRFLAQFDAEQWMAYLGSGCGRLAGHQPPADLMLEKQPIQFVRHAFPGNPARLRPEPLPISAGGDPCVSLEEIAEKGDILITDRITDLLHCAMIAL